MRGTLRGETEGKKGGCQSKQGTAKNRLNRGSKQIEVTVIDAKKMRGS